MALADSSNCNVTVALSQTESEVPTGHPRNQRQDPAGCASLQECNFHVERTTHLVN